METSTFTSLLAIELPSVVSPPLLWRLQLFQYSTATKKASQRWFHIYYMIIHQFLHLIHANVLDVHYQYNV